MNYLDSGFDIFLRRSTYDTGQYDKANIGDLLVSGAVTDTQIGSVSFDKVENVGIDIEGWSTNIVFTQSDHNTLNWAAGKIKLSNGTEYSIAGSNTGEVAETTYIYFDLAVSSTALQITTTASTAVGANKILVAVCKNVEVGKLISYQVFGGMGQGLITASDIASNTITANEIAANTITANKLTITTLSAISANMGTITAGTITGALIQTAATGYRALLTSANGFQLYNGATWQGSLQADSNASVVLNSAGNIYLMRNGAQMAFFTGNSIDLPSTMAITWAGGGNLSYGGSYVKTNINFRADSFEAKGSGSTYYIGGTDDFAVVEAIDQQKTDGYVSNIRVGKRRLYFVGGLFRYAGPGYWEDAQ